MFQSGAPASHWIMSSPLAALRSDWKCFKRDPAGERFERQHDRTRKRSPALRIALAVLGGLLIAGGVVLLFIPGPGLPVALLGVALVASASRRMARWLDRVEPALRRRWTRTKRWWKRRRRRSRR